MDSPTAISSSNLRDPASPPSPPCSPPLPAPSTDPHTQRSKRSSLARLSVPSENPHLTISQADDPGAYQDRAMQHPLWTPRGAERLSSQDMEKHYSADHHSRHADDNRDSSQRSKFKKDVGALFSLMIVAPFVGMGICFYALAVFLILSLAAPIVLFVAGKAALKSHYLAALLPGLNLHYRMAYSSRRCRVGTTARSWPGSLSYPQSPTSSYFSDLDEKPSATPSVARLMVVLLLSPLVSIPIALVNFTIMFFWPMSALTDSAGSGSSMDDGHRMAKRVRRFWIRWLSGDLSSRAHASRRRHDRPTNRG